MSPGIFLPQVDRSRLILGHAHGRMVTQATARLARTSAFAERRRSDHDYYLYSAPFEAQAGSGANVDHGSV